MTEEEWFGKPTIDAMLEHVRPRLRKRKRALFVAACCYRVWHLLEDERHKKAVQAGEEFADGLIDRKTLESAIDAAELASGEIYLKYFDRNSPMRAIGAAQALAYARHFANTSCLFVHVVKELDVHSAPEYAAEAIGKTAGNTNKRQKSFINNKRQSAVAEAEREHQRTLLRDIAGNPFKRRRRLSATVQTPTVISLANGIYLDRAFDRLPVLADALEEAGCTDEVILAHCRGPSPHVRGCWVVDLLLGKV